MRQQAIVRVKTMTKKTIFWGLVTVLLINAMVAIAQQPRKIPRIGYLSARDPANDSSRAEGVRLGLRELGYIEGQNIAIEYRYAEGKSDRFPKLVRQIALQYRYHLSSRRRRPAQGRHQCDQDDSHHHDRRWCRSCQSRLR